MGAAIDRVDLPCDRPRPAIRSASWQRVPGRLPPNVDAPRALAAFALCVGKLANAREFVIGTPAGVVAIALAPDDTLAQVVARLAAAAVVDVEPSTDPARHPTCDVGFGDGDPQGDLHLRVRAGAFELFYDATLFSGERAKRLARAYAHVARAAIDVSIGGIGLLDDAEAADQLAELSTPQFNWPQHLVLHELFEAKVDQTPDAIALVHGARRITYGELDARANALAARLVARGVGADAICALACERSPEMIVAILGVLKAGGAYLPIEPDAPAERVRYLLDDSRAACVVTTAELAPAFGELAVVVDDNGARERLPRRAEPHHLAYVIYTSGSTGQPKGVLVEHRNVVHLVLAEKADFAIRSSDALILLSSYSFDASIDQIWLALATGAKLVIVDKDELLDPAGLAATISREAVTHLDAVPALLAELSPMLPTVRQVVVGGETCPVAVARAWSRAVRLWNEYGPTETTVGSLRHHVDPAIDLGDRVPVGRPIGMTRVYVLDWGGQPVPPGVRGELFLGGAGVARGYLGRDALTRERFVRDPFAAADARMYRTGDLVAWLPDGGIEFFGRADSQVKVRGFRVELGEIEAAVLRHAEVSGAAASVVAGDRLVCHVVASRSLDAAELRELLARSLPAYMIPDVFVQLDAFPRTVSGKIDRKALPPPVLGDGAATAEPPANRVESELRAVWAALLALPAERVSVTRSFFELGGHSLLVMQMLTRVRERLGVALSSQTVLAAPTIRAIAAAIASGSDGAPATAGDVPRADATSALPATSVQRRLYVIQQGNPRSTSYNLPLVYELDGDLDPDAIARACAQLVERHEALRTAFFFQEGEILQKIARAGGRFELERFELADGADVAAIAAQFVRPFRLEAPPLFRAAVVMERGRVAYLALDMHHIVSDGTSIDTLVDDLLALVQQRALPEVTLRYFDYSAWLASDAGRARLAAAKTYWAGVLRDDLPALDLPYDFRRPLSRAQAAGELTVELPAATVAAIAARARELGATPFAFHAALYSVFLSCMTGSEDVVFGFPSAGRPHPDFERVVGMFVNSLPFRARVDADDSFAALVRRAMQQIAASLRAEDYPFEDMVGDLGAPPPPGRNPLFDTMLSYEGATPDVYRCGDAVLREHRLPQQVARMDLVVVIREHAGGHASVRFEYSADLFRRGTVERFARDFAALIERALAEPAVTLAELHVVDAAAREQLVVEFNATAHELPPVRAVHELFEQHADRAPEAIAVELGDLAWSYGEVERRANALAHRLRARGVGRDALVAIELAPCADMLVAVLGVMKSGGAFLPIDPDYPAARKAHMLDDSGARVVLREPDLRELDAGELRADRVDAGVERDDLAYCIYTSGSTGTPKGTLIPHRGLLNFAAWYADFFAIRAGDGVSKYAGFGFDASISEIVPCFISGARLVVVPADLRVNVDELDAYFAAHGVAIAFLPTQFGEQFLRAATRHQLRMAFLGGDKLRNRPTDRCTIVNGYGPTEYTVAATAFRVDRAYDNIPIGKPLWNTQIAILDRLGRLCPIGVAGELCIAGASMARGYLHRPELTAEKFVPHPLEPAGSKRRMYRSGDLARWLDDGNIEFLGRIDTQVKVRGFRVELGEIEQGLLALPGVAAAVVVARDNPAVAGDQALVGFVVAADAFDEAALKAALGRTLPAFMIPTRVVRVADIPVTANGKVDKRRLPEVELELGAIVAPRDAREAALRDLYAEILGRPAETISVDAGFVELGGHSLRAAALLSELYRRDGVQLRFAELLDHSSVAELARLLAAKSSGGRTELSAPPDEFVRAPDGPVPATASQRRIFAVHQLSTWSTAYNIPFAWELAADVDLDRLAAALAQLVSRHHALRASFAADGTQTFAAPADARVEVARLDVEDASLRGTLDRFVRPFELAVAPLARVAIICTPVRRVLALDVHHIVADGLSVRLLLEDLEVVYADPAAPPPAGPTFADYAHWEASDGGRANTDAERAWWLARFADAPSPLELPSDFDRPPRLAFDGDEVALELPVETAAPLRELARAHGVTPMNVFLAAYAVLLSRLGNTPDVVVGVPAAGRHRAGMARMVGMFVNTVPLRLQLRRDEPFAALCKRLAAEAADAFERQSYQLDELVTDLRLARDPARNPLFDVLFAWEEAELAEIEGSALGLVEIPAPPTTCKFDLELTVQNTARGQRIALGFAKKLFRRSTAERFLGNLRKILEVVAREPAARIDEIRMLQPWEREILLSEFNRTAVAVPRDASLVELYAEHVRARPEAPAVVDARGSYSFAELDRRSDALAVQLAARGVGDDDVVALAMERSRELLVAIVGVWKAGAGYLPIELDAPAERAATIVGDARAKLLLTQGPGFGLAGELVQPWSALDLASARSGARVPSRARPGGIAYVIYTSGSTGKPKGVVIEHGHAVNFIATSRATLGVDHTDRVLLFSSYTFDASVAQLGLALAAGAPLVVPTKDVLLDHDAFEQFLVDHGVTHLDCVPLFLGGFHPKRPLPLRRIVVGGDICPVPVAERWATGGRAFYNEYGPTETTITSLRHRATTDDLALSRIPVGRPVANTQIYILDWTDSLAPLGVPGEMYIGGAGVARGYLNDPQRTGERFVTHTLAGGGRIYKTGDNARWLPDGTIDFLGRADNQIKIRGFRVELGEIEAALLRHPQVAEAAVIVAPHGDAELHDKRLCGYVVVRDAAATGASVRSFLARTLPSYMVPDAIAVLAALPVTTSGKIDRKRLPEPVFEVATEDDAPATLAEDKLVEIWADVLRLPRHQVPVERSFFELGGHSLLIMIVLSRVHQTFSVRLAAADVFEHPTVRALARLIEDHERSAIVPIPHVDGRVHYPLSAVQRRMFAIHQTQPLGVQYNMPTVFAVERSGSAGPRSAADGQRGESVERSGSAGPRSAADGQRGESIEGRVTPERLEEVVRALIARHASLRTSFHVEDGEPVQRIHATAPFTLRVVDSDDPIDTLMQRLMQPFDLAVAPLWRVWLVRRSSGDELLVVDMHHIIADGYATAILWREITDVIRGVSLAAPKITAGDYALWQRGDVHAADLAQQRAFWLAQYDHGRDLPAPLQLPYDFRHPAVRSHAGDLVIEALGKDELAALTALSRGEGSTLFATLLAAWFVYLARIGGSDDVVVGVPVSGRAHPDLQDVVGMFVNTVPWRAKVPATGTFRDFLRATRATSLQVLASEDYQLDDLLAELDVRSLPGRNPLFDVMFVFETRELEVIDAERVKLRFVDFLHKTAKLDLVLVATESDAGLELAFEYATELFERATVERVARQFVTLLRDIVRSPDKEVGALEVLQPDERAQLVDGFNATEHELPAVAGVHELWASWVVRAPDVPAVVFGDTSWTYAEVDRRANAIAAWLAARGVGRDDVVAILLEPCAEMVPAMLGVMKAGAAFLPVDSEYPAGRKAYLLEDSRAKALLTTPALALEFAGPTLDVSTSGRLVAPPRAAIAPTDAAYVIYTSGSTGKPKGVVVEHAALVNFSLWYADYYGIQPREGVSKYAGFSFDASISEVFPAIVAGATLVVVPAEMRLAPRELSAYYGAHGVRVAFLPTQFGEQFVRIADSHGLRIVTLAGEKMRAYKPMPWTVVNGYGPTEYTVCTTAFVVDRAWDNIPIGKPVWNTQILVLDRHGRLCPIGVAGELCVAGAGLARGYLGRPELTADKFVAHPFAAPGSGTRMYRTGDLARWRADGNLEYLGRIDTQVKVRGYRIELGEIEQTLMEQPGVREATVIDLVDDTGATQLAAYVAGDAVFDDVRAALGYHLPDYMIPAYFTRVDALPLTPNGKVDRKALPPLARDAGRAFVAPETDGERAVAALWARVLAVPLDRLGVTASFVELGGHSLKAIALVTEVYKELGVELKVSDVFRHPTVRAMARRLAGLADDPGLGSIPPAPHAESYPASSVQARMFLLQQMEPASTAYNVASLFAVAPGVTYEDVARAVGEVVRRHDAFRCSFYLDGTDARLRVAPRAELHVRRVDTTEAERDAMVDALVRPFDLGAAPLARAAWLATERGNYLVFDMHHIATDGVAMALLVDELEQLVAGATPSEPAIGLVDCTAWERGERAGTLVAAQRAYWKAAFPDGVPQLALVTDFPRPPVVLPEGETLSRELPAAVARRLRELARRLGVSLNAVMLAAFDVFLARVTRQDDVAVGSPVSGRWHPDMQHVFGMFVNTVVLAQRVDGKQPFVDLVADVSRRSLEALDNQAYPFADLVELIGDGRHAGHTPLVDVMFAMQSADDRTGDGAARSATFTPLPTSNHTAKFDLSLVVDDLGDALHLAIEYRTSLFRATTIERFLRCLDALYADVVAHPEAPVEQLSILADDDRRLVHVEFNCTEVAYPDEIAAHAMFEKAAARVPSKRALVSGDRSYTYAEVDAAANRLANRLLRLGLARQGIVAILTRPSCELVIAELAALKAGGAFMPLDHRYPRERLEYMLRDSAARVLIAEPDLARDLDFAGHRLVLEPALFAAAPAPGAAAATRPPVPPRRDDLAYVIYTSGSTGRPKGVAIEHRSLVPFIQRTVDVYKLTDRDRHSKYAGIGFDVSIIETFPPLCVGGELHVVPDALRLDLPALTDWIDRNGITVMDLPTQLAEELMKQPRQPRLRWLTVGGDRLRRFRPAPYKLANEYGPTEFTVSATTFVVDQQYDNIPIGKPNANTTVLILDPSGQLTPPGVPGEICLAGKGLARGYLGAPELTAKKFVHHPLAGGRMYHTGDLGRWLDDGNIEFLGRIDSQVKIRGFRIELGEVEQAILEVPGVSACVVIDRDDAAGDKVLVGYYTRSNATSGVVARIQAHLATRLPDYMAPVAYVELAEIPFTTSGKVDRRRLPEPELRAAERAIVAPANMAETLVVDAFARALGRTDLGATDDFFDLGGNSIKAVAAVAALAADFRITANDLFRLRTARDVAREIPMRRGDLRARLVAIADDIRAGDGGDPLADLGDLAPELARYRRRYQPFTGASVRQQMSYRDILLTGATGYLGSYLLRDLLTTTDAKIHVAVRAAKRGEAWERLSAKMASYFGRELLETHRRRVNVVMGDLGEAQLGLDRGPFDALARTIDCVIHAAALTKHYGDHATFVRANVDATQNVIALARRAGCDFNLVSTISVGAGDIPGKKRALFTEFDCDIGQVADNHYVRTKLDAEKAVLELRADGVACNIFRVGFLTGDSKTLRFQDNAGDSGFVQTLRSYVALKRIPESALAQSFCPVNEVSEAILRLLGASSLLDQTHHVDRVIDASDARAALAADTRCEVLDDASFFGWLADHVGDAQVGQAATAMLLHEGLLDRGGSTETVTLREKSDALLARAGFAWSGVRPEQVWSLVD
nr:amino acid adenylation domain-containing protein [Kofleriaceae bacterium]